MSSYKKQATVMLKTARTPLELRLINHRFQTVAYGVGTIRKKVAPGLYQIEVRSGSTSKREYIELKPGEIFEKTNIDLPIQTIAPVSGAINSHETHGYPTEHITKTPNRHYGEGGRLVLIFRNVGQDYQKPIDISTFELLDTNFKLIDDLLPENATTDGGLIGFSGDANPGGYVLRNRTEWEPNRSTQDKPMGADLPIWVEPDWMTIVFIPNLEDRSVPSLRFASIHMAPIWAGFYYDDGSQINAAVELALSGLRQGRSVITKSMLSMLLNEKFTNPMLGIIGAQAILLQANPNWNLFDTVRRNLKKIIPNHPDVTALFVSGKERRGNESRSRVKKLDFPPMLAEGYRGAIERDAEEPGLIVGNSLADQAASRLYQQGPWTLWKPFEFSAETGIDASLLEDIAQIERMVSSPTTPLTDNVSQLWRSVEKEGAPSTGTLSDPEVRYVAEFMQRTAQNESTQGAVRGAKQSYTDEFTTIEIKTLSKTIGLPVSSVMRAIKTITEQGFSNKE